MKRQILIFLLIFSINVTVEAQSKNIIKSFNDLNSWTDYATCAKPTPDGGTVIAGMIADTITPYPTQLFLMKLDTSFNIIWAKCYSSSQPNDGIYNLDLTDDGGYLLIGNYTANLLNPEGFCVIKTDSAGNFQWSYAYPGYIAIGYSRTSDNGYILCGSSSGSNNTIIGLTRIGHNGKLVWSKSYAGTVGYPDIATAVKETYDHNFLVTGLTWGFGVTNNAILLMKTDSLGNFIWAKTIDGPDFDGCYDIISTADSGFMISAGGSSPTSYHPLLIKTDKSGNILWKKLYGPYVGTAPDFGNVAARVIRTNDHGYAFYYDDFSPTSFIVKTDSSGNFQWAKNFPDTIYYQTSYLFYSLWQTSNNDYAYCISSKTNNGDIYIARTNDQPDSCSTWYSTFWESPFSAVISSVTLTVNSSYLQDTINYVEYPVSFTAMLLCLNNDVFVNVDNHNNSKGYLDIYPNPFSREATLSSNENFTNGTLTIYNGLGQEVKIIKNISGQETKIQRDNLPGGIYFIRLTQDNTVRTGKIIIAD